MRPEKQGINKSELSVGVLDKIIAPDAFVRVIDLFVDKLGDLTLPGFSQSPQRAREVGGAPAYSHSTLLKCYLYGYPDIHRLQHAAQCVHTDRSGPAERPEKLETGYGMGEKSPFGAIQGHFDGLGGHNPGFENKFRPQIAILQSRFLGLEMRMRGGFLHKLPLSFIKKSKQYENQIV